jgi:hypothetical protein
MTEDELLSMRNVPVQVAAEYLGVSPKFIRFGIVQRTLPIGSYVNLGGTRNTFHISPARLIEYQCSRKKEK